ncbi:MAG: tetratricopeptide repeat protein [Bacteroidia bacterium]|nr:tetratricopeptide repeat protein [Bacteroidia bacterium]NNJ54781.1 tetratricopeptide repeat protein [Bacteroidia bacterium]
MNNKELFDKGEYETLVARLSDLKDVESLTLLGYSYQKLGKWESAMDVWTQLIVLNPYHADFYNERGVCKFQLRFKHAIQDFDKAIELVPTNPYFYGCRAYIKDKTGDTEGAIEDYNKAHILDPEDATTLNNLGLAEQKLGYTQRARERFKNSDDLLGIKTIDSRAEPPSTPEKNSIWKEFKKMISSKKGFFDFLEDAGLKRKK